jgi:hypothetical protein
MSWTLGFGGFSRSLACTYIPSSTSQFKFSESRMNHTPMRTSSPLHATAARINDDHLISFHRESLVCICMSSAPFLSSLFKEC